MSTADIVRVWGTADGAELELKIHNGRWVCSLPPDFIDGQYAILLYAMRGNGSVGTWTGILYVSDGMSCVHLMLEKWHIWCSGDRCTISLLPEKIKDIIQLTPRLRVMLKAEKARINLIKECCCDG